MRYIIIGNGKVAKHFAQYLEQKKLPYSKWHYKDKIFLNDFLNNIKEQYHLSDSELRVFILIKDSEINNLYNENTELHNIGYIFHCSGALITDNIITLHPLMTFSNNFHELSIYESLAFITSTTTNKKSNKNKLDIKNYLPGLDNKIYSIPDDKMAYYHALCVSTGNFAQILWQSATAELTNKLNLPREIINPYITNITSNYINNPDNCLTGPLARNDQGTINKNIEALENNNSILLDTYKNFCELYSEQHEK